MIFNISLLSLSLSQLILDSSLVPVDELAHIHHLGAWLVRWRTAPRWAVTEGMKETDTSISQRPCQNREGICKLWKNKHKKHARAVFRLGSSVGRLLCFSWFFVEFNLTWRKLIGRVYDWDALRNCLANRLALLTSALPQEVKSAIFPCLLITSYLAASRSC